MIGKEKHTSFVTIVNCAAHDMYYELLGNFQIYFSCHPLTTDLQDWQEKSKYKFDDI